MIHLALPSIMIGLAVGLAACGSQIATTPPQDAVAESTAAPASSPAPSAVGNPAAPGFNAADSDARAIVLADKVMERLGGRTAWDGTRYLTWKFFGGRRHVWDKLTGDHRFEDGELIVLSNLHDRVGRAWQAGVEVFDPDTLAAQLDKTYASWINDSYWLVMPYKLKDSGVTLTYHGEGMTEEGLPAHIVELTFKDVGRTPQNRYQVWVDINDSFVRQWSFYRESTDAEPAFTMPWANWQPHGDIWLNDDFGRRRHTEIHVLEQVTEGLFEDPKKYLQLE